MTLTDSIILGIIEGITEFLPISSTGHLMLASKVLGLEQTEFIKTFEIAIQLGAILSVVVLYWRSFLNCEINKRIAAAFIPTAVVGLILYKIIKKFFMSEVTIVLCSLFVGGIIIILFEKFYKPRPYAETEVVKIPLSTAVLIGLCQSLAMVPGVSRSAATIIGGLALNIDRKAIVEFSFLLAVPTMFAATVLDLWKHRHAFNSTQIDLLGVGFVVSFVVALVSIKLLMEFVKRFNFTTFGIYRIVVAIGFWLIFYLN